MPVKIIVKTLTPIHIGTNQSLQPEDYYYSNGISFCIDKEQCFKFIQQKIGTDTFFQKFNEWINDVSINLENLAGKTSRQSFKISLFDFVENYLKNKDLSNELISNIIKNKDFSYYSVASPLKPTREVRVQIKTGDFIPYIPGGSLKGLFRNALTNFVINNDNSLAIELQRYVNRRLNNIKRKFSEQADRKNTLIKKLKNDDNSYLNNIFRCKFQNERQETKFDVKYDLFKFIQISDLFPVEKECLTLIEPENVTAKGRAKMTPFLEAIKENSVLEGTLTIKFDELKELYRSFPKIREKKWIGLEEKFRLLFDTELSKITSLERKDLENILVERLSEVLEDFSAAIVNKDLKWLESITNLANLERVKYFYDNLPNKAVKLGFSSGFHSVTVYDAILQNKDNTELFKNYVELLRSLEILKTNIESFPKHRKFIKMANNIEATFGWVTIDFNS